jgi:hypothetical protein
MRRLRNGCGQNYTVPIRLKPRRGKADSFQSDISGVRDFAGHLSILRRMPVTLKPVRNSRSTPRSPTLPPICSEVSPSFSSTMRHHLVRINATTAPRIAESVLSLQSFPRFGNQDESFRQMRRSCSTSSQIANAWPSSGLR